MGTSSGGKVPGVAASSLERQSHSEREPSSTGSPSVEKAGLEDVAVGRVLVRHVRDRALHRVVGVALAVGGDRVHPRDALVLALDPVVLGDALGAVVLEEVVEVAEVGRVDVLEREPGALGPRQRDPDQVVDHRAVLGGVDRPRLVADLHLGRLHRLRLAVDDVGVRVTRGKRQLERREAPRGRDGVRPREAARVPDQDQRDAVERAAGHVDLARDPQVGLVQALGAVPREVRVAEHEAAAVVGCLAAEAVGVRADLRLETCEPLAGREHLVALRVGRPGPPPARRARRRRCRR